MLPVGVRFLRDCRRCTGARAAVPGVGVVDAGAGLAEVLGVALASGPLPSVFRAGADDAPRREAALGGISME